MLNEKPESCRYRKIELAVWILLAISGCTGEDHQDRPEGKSAAIPDNEVAHQNQPAIRNPISWIGNGQWMKVDTHSHTLFSDGRYPVIAVVESAQKYGCDAIAITDHASHDLTAATEEYFTQIRAAQKLFPKIVVIPGLEWNVPPYDGNEHVTVLTIPGSDAWLRQFKEQFDGYQHPGVPPASEALRWIEENKKDEAVLILNHPSRKRTDPTTIVEDALTWLKASQSFIGFAGSPGHQNKAKVGSYLGKLKTVDRWDPAAETVGGAWDKLLGDGLHVYAALAPSDFHSPTSGDYWPGEFSETWVYSPERSASGVLDALKAGSFFASHGGIAQRVELQVKCEGLERPAFAGETLYAAGKRIDISIRMQIPEIDLLGHPNSVDELELIAIVDGKASIVAKQAPQKTLTDILSNFEVPATGAVFRARGRRFVDNGADLMFYTNPVWVTASP
ncbi:CehA/McbA family metallohydrolase [Stieleria sp. JC731]|uniref:CehA/McbA family metallohydrolase n=1 Tax=Pirellulaceae TaxID=2691357 RepID=UPI001E3EF404|nr:CehA/McbA family metallohydrolase [Stieleria sp. JC731]MCC9601467.1 CehA/McbA family metallohydrolase [Stieleria sp. JC731]